MSEVLIGTVLSVLTGVGLWAVLPRGVVLTRSVRGRNFAGDPLPDTWELRNDSALPVHIVSVTTRGIQTFDPESGKIHDIEVPPEPGEDLGVSLHFDDEQLEIARSDRGRTWRGLIVPPGDALQVTVMNNRTLRIRYRRAGALGVLERREVSIHGGA
jgi:hypothetical protein